MESFVNQKTNQQLIQDMQAQTDKVLINLIINNHKLTKLHDNVESLNQEEGDNQ